jgi:hypothetical protein
MSPCESPNRPKCTILDQASLSDPRCEECPHLVQDLIYGRMYGRDSREYMHRKKQREQRQREERESTPDVDEQWL